MFFFCLCAQAVSSDGTVIGPAPNYPNSGLGPPSQTKTFLASRPVRTPQANPGSRYRCGKEHLRAACGRRQEERGAKIRSGPKQTMDACVSSRRPAPLHWHHDRCASPKAQKAARVVVFSLWSFRSSISCRLLHRSGYAGTTCTGLPPPLLALRRAGCLPQCAKQE